MTDLHTASAAAELIASATERHDRCVAELRRAEAAYYRVASTLDVTSPERLLAFSAVQTCRANLDLALEDLEVAGIANEGDDR